MHLLAPVSVPAHGGAGTAVDLGELQRNMRARLPGISATPNPDAAEEMCCSSSDATEAGSEAPTMAPRKGRNGYNRAPLPVCVCVCILLANAAKHSKPRVLSQMVPQSSTMGQWMNAKGKNTTNTES